MVLVTGITGKSGKWFLKRAIKENSPFLQFRAAVRKTSNTSVLDESPVKFEKMRGDLDDNTFTDAIMDGVSTVLHIAGIHWSLNVVQAAIKHNVQWLILVHTTGIYSKYKSASREYLSIEQEIEALIKNTNIKLTILRPTMIYGSITDKNIIVFIKMIDKLKIFPVINHARYSLQPVHEKDLGNAYWQVLVNKDKTENKNYNLSGKEPIMLIDMLKIIGRSLGKANVFVSIPFPLAYIGGWLLYIFTFGRIDYREKIQRLVEDRVFNHDDASRDFGYAPAGFADGVQEEINEYLNK